MCISKKHFGTGRVYAAPDPEWRRKRKNYLTQCVYAGPEEVGAPADPPSSAEYPFNNASDALEDGSDEADPSVSKESENECF